VEPSWGVGEEMASRPNRDSQKQSSFGPAICYILPGLSGGTITLQDYKKHTRVLVHIQQHLDDDLALTVGGTGLLLPFSFHVFLRAW
jgi:hypothetical protein